MTDLLIFRNKVIAVDIVENAQFSLSADLTSYAVEDGATRADAKIKAPNTVSVNVLQTEHPIQAEGLEPRSVTLSLPKNPRSLSPSSLIRGALGADRSPESIAFSPLKFARPTDRGGALEDVLVEIFNSDETCSVITSGRRRSNMSLIGLTRLSREPGASQFQLEFKELRISRGREVAVVDVASLAEKIEKGKQAEESVKKESDSSRKPKSILKTLLGG